MSFFDYLKKKPNSDKGKEKIKKDVENTEDLSKSLDKQMDENQESIQSIMAELDEAIADINMRLEKEEQGKETNNFIK